MIKNKGLLILKKVKDMKFKDLKSWQISLIGTILQPLILMAGLIFLWIWNQGRSSEFMGVSINFISLGLIIAAIYLIAGSIPTALLYFDRTKKLGAIISIIFGIELFYIIDINPFEIFSAFIILNILGFFLIFAGITYFIKKV